MASIYYLLQVNLNVHDLFQSIRCGHSAPKGKDVAFKNSNSLHAGKVSPSPVRLAFLAKDTQKPSWFLIRALRAAVGLRSTRSGEFFGDAREFRMRMKLGIKSRLRSEIETNDNEREIKMLTLGCVKLGDFGIGMRSSGDTQSLYCT